jgi:signal transduction histidine kinase
MTRYRMKLIIALMCAAIVAVVVLQASWLMNSYAVSKEKNEADIKVLLDAAINEQKRIAADTVRMLMKKVIRTEKDFKYRIVDFPTGLKIGFAAAEQGAFTLFAASAKDTLALRKDAYNFVIKKIAELKLDELYPLYSALIGVSQYADHTPERSIQLKLSKSFSPHEDIAGLTSIVEKIFSNEGKPFSGTLRCFKDIGNVYTKPKTTKPAKKQFLNAPDNSIAVFSGSEHSRSLAIKLDLLEIYTDSLNQLGDSTFVAKPLLHDLNQILREEVPTILLSVNTPRTLICQKMSAGIFGSFALMLFITLSVVYMYNTIVKQKQLSDLKNDFISNISHELKTPIATAQAAVQGLKFFDNSQNPEKANSYLTTALSEIQRLSLMVDKILNISLFESFTFTLSPERFDFKSLLTGIVESQKVGKEKPVEITLDYEAKTEIFADKTQLTNVMINLIDNAVKYSGQQVRIDIKCRNYDGGIEVLVTDNGNGIPAEFSDFIFDKFFRVPDLNGHMVKGYGLGLNFVKTIVEKHRGAITLSDSGEQGSTFVIKIPQQ